MKLISKLKIIILALFSVIAVSCLDDSVTDFGNGPIVIQFPSAKMTENFLQDENNNKVYDFEIPVQYFGMDNTPLNEDITLTIGINAAQTTATAGNEFDLPKTTFTIPSGTNTAKVNLKVNSASLDPENPKVVALEILESSKKVSSNKNIILLTLQAICPSSFEGTYKYIGGRGKTVEIKSTGVGTYSISADNIFRGTYSFNISDVCNKITVTGGFLSDNFGIAVSGGGSRDPLTGRITLSYTADGYFDSREMILEKQ
ncbi:hypothetical protein [Tenacibaculum maritimum]|uniref:hypothetical protein n=1 Tax=Tenacibaculum maritimum TaxID=107401 RepID=UPI0038777B02